MKKEGDTILLKSKDPEVAHLKIDKGTVAIYPLGSTIVKDKSGKVLFGEEFKDNRMGNWPTIDAYFKAIKDRAKS